jgi:hypothetical protein
MKHVPTCPSCKKEYTLILTEGNDELRIRCAPDCGGCGMFYYPADLPRLYKMKSGLSQ